MVTRFFHWRCDLCERKIFLEHYGLPEGWVYLKPILWKRKEVRHACENCRGYFPRIEWGTECQAKIPA